MTSVVKLSVIIPVYNERKTIEKIIKRVSKVSIANEIIIVDDGSNDGTKEILKNKKEKIKKKKGLKIVFLFHEENQGKGAAVRTALKRVTGDYVVIQDADLEYDPQDYLKLLEPIKERKAEVVYGSRFTGPHRNMFFWHMVGNKLITLITNILYDSTLSDMETCYKLIPTKLLKSLELKSKSFNFEPEVTAKILKREIRIYEVPISYTGREYHEGKKIRWYDGLIAFWTLLKYRFVD